MNNDLTKRILFVIGMLLLYRVGTYIPLPGINNAVLSSFIKENSGGMLAMFNMFTGGALGRMSIFALNIMPYITASILMQLFSMVSKDLSTMRKEGDIGRKKIAQYTRYLTIVLATFQGYGIAIGAENMSISGASVVLEPGVIFRFISTISLVGSTVFIIWMTDQISMKGIGNGSSLVIFTGIVAGLPSALGSLLEMGKSGSLSLISIAMILLICTGLVMTIIFFEKAQRKIQVTYPKRQVGNKIYGGDSTHMPLKLNTAGVLGPIFASSLLLFPATVMGFLGVNSDPESLQYQIMFHLSHGRLAYMIIYVLLICFFSFFYTSVVFNPEETAENLRQGGAIITSKRPGAQTALYLNYVLTRITVLGAMYVSFICVLPEVLIAHYSIPFYLGGTSLLIVVNVVIDMFQQVQTHLLSGHYNSLKKNSPLLTKRNKK